MNVTYQNGWAVPAGWKLVPEKPTYELECEVGGVRMDEEFFLYEYADHEKLGEICRAVVKYSPPPPKAPDYNPGPLDVSVVGMPEFDALLDHIYEEGTGSEGAVHLANKLVRAAIQSYISYARNVQPAEEYLSQAMTSPGVPEPVVTDEMVEAVQRIRETAMRETVIARIPESGEFGSIAQDADWLLYALKAAKEAETMRKQMES